MARGEPRRTQAERTAATKEALLQATIDSLVEVGYAATTTVEVTRRAGVSLGALLHHYPAKIDLLVDAVSHLCDQRLDEFRKGMADLDSAVDRVDAALDLLWSCMSGPTFIAWTELWVGSRTEPELSEAVIEMDKRFMSQATETYVELFPPDAEGTQAELLEIGLALPFSVMDGLALGRLHQPYEPYPADKLIDVLKGLSRMVFPR